METRRRTLLKLSGEALGSDAGHGICSDVLEQISQEIAGCARDGFQVAIVVGGGNFMRGSTSSHLGLSRSELDNMGMLATAMNAIALGGAINSKGADARVLTPLEGLAGCERYHVPKARRALSRGEVVVLGGGLGVPFCTTDTAATVRALELGADELLKASLVDGIYDRDPNKYSGAVKFSHLTYSDALSRELAVMDAGAFAIARDQDLPMRVFSMLDPQNLSAAIRGRDIGTVVSSERPPCEVRPLRAA